MTKKARKKAHKNKKPGATRTTPGKGKRIQIAFEAMRSERYHEFREAWFKNMNGWLTVLAAAMGLIAAASVCLKMGEGINWLTLFSLISPGLLLIKMAFNPTGMMAEHRSLREACSELAHDAQTEQRKKPGNDLEWDLAQIKQDEPPKLTLLEAICDRAQKQASGLDLRKTRFPLWRKLLKNLWSQEEYCISMGIIPASRCDGIGSKISETPSPPPQADGNSSKWSTWWTIAAALVTATLAALLVLQ